MADDLGWDRGVLNYAHAISSVTAGVGMIIFGKLITKYGIRLPAMAMLIIFSLSLVLIGKILNSPVYLYLLFAIYGLTGAAATAIP